MAMLRKTHLIIVSAALSYYLAHHWSTYSVKGSYGLTFVAVSVLLLTSRYIYRHILYPKLLSPLRDIPVVPGGTFFNGHGWQILKETTGLPHRRWVHSVKHNGLIRYHYFGNIERVMVASPETLREVLVTRCYDFEKPPLARVNLGRLLGVGVLVAEGDEHKIQRKNLMPAFQYRHIRDLYPVFWEKSKLMVDAVTNEIAEDQRKIQTPGGYSIVNFGDWLSRCTLDIIGLAGMGFDFNAIADPNNELIKTYKNIFNPKGFSVKVFFVLNQVIPTWLFEKLPIKRNLEVVEAASVVRSVSHDLIKHKQTKMAEKPDVIDKDIISVALSSGVFSVENLVDQCMTFLAAGHETTATATSWALLELCRQPSIQARLREEIRTLLPSPSSTVPLTADLVDKLPYLHAVCNEVLRFYSPVPLTRRVAIKDTVVGGHPLPKGTEIIIAPWATNFDSSLWGSDADKFNPDRWMGEKRANTGGAESNFANLTFLHGPRSCIGLGFAKAEFSVLLASIVGSFEFEFGSEEFRGTEAQTGIVARPKGGVTLKMRALDGW